MNRHNYAEFNQQMDYFKKKISYCGKGASRGEWIEASVVFPGLARDAGNCRHRLQAHCRQQQQH